MKEVTIAAVKRADSTRADFVLRVHDPRATEPRCHLEAVFDGRTWARAAGDYFAALALVRCDLEADGWLLSCFGASRNVYPSAMSRDMGLGLKAYRTQLGVPGRREDLVGIFDTGPDVEPATVDEQRAFHDAWFASLKGT